MMAMKTTLKMTLRLLCLWCFGLSMVCCSAHVSTSMH